MSARTKHQPQRTCVVCRRKLDKRQLTRLVHTADGLFIDPSGKREGRGAYLCEQPACWRRAAESRVLDRAFRTSLTDAERARLRETVT